MICTVGLRIDPSFLLVCGSNLLKLLRCKVKLASRTSNALFERAMRAEALPFEQVKIPWTEFAEAVGLGARVQGPEDTGEGSFECDDDSANGGSVCGRWYTAVGQDSDVSDLVALT